MPEYFVVTNSFAAPFVSDRDEEYVEADDPRAALERVASTYSHPAGLYAANCYASHKDFLENKDPLARWLCNHEQTRQRVTAGKGAYSYLGIRPGEFEVDRERIIVPNPKAGSVV